MQRRRCGAHGGSASQEGAAWGGRNEAWSMVNQRGSKTESRCGAGGGKAPAGCRARIPFGKQGVKEQGEGASRGPVDVQLASQWVAQARPVSQSSLLRELPGGRGSSGGSRPPLGRAIASATAALPPLACGSSCGGSGGGLSCCTAVAAAVSSLARSWAARWPASMRSRMSSLQQRAERGERIAELSQRGRPGGGPSRQPALGLRPRLGTACCTLQQPWCRRPPTSPEHDCDPLEELGQQAQRRHGGSVQPVLGAPPRAADAQLQREAVANHVVADLAGG